jgi:hypothetical protein
MIQKLKTLLLSVSTLFVIAVPMLAGVAQAADPNPIDSEKCGSIFNFTDNNCPTDNGSKLSVFVKKLINVLSLLVGAVAVIMIIYGGFRYVTSGGSESSVSSAKNTILYAVIGLVIVALAQVIVHFVLNNLAG